MGYRIERLAAHHDRTAFDCGVESLNTFLREHARRNAKQDFSATFVAVPEGETRVLAYYAISSGHVAAELLPPDVRRRLPRYPAPVVRLGRIASDLTVRGQRLGEAMLLDALKRALAISEELGVYAVELDALSEGARRFYERYGFTPLEDDPLHLYLPMRTIRTLFADEP
ncbi:MAG TPA: GNAT family N-acetyltransferase [Rhodothermales bacterium]|nr:GNAT family N-acetyltransferase [Rhodothermales bacterium]